MDDQRQLDEIAQKQEQEEIAAFEAEQEKNASREDKQAKQRIMEQLGEIDPTVTAEPQPAHGELMAPVSTLEQDGNLFCWTVGDERLKVTLDEARARIAKPTRQGKRPSDDDVIRFLRQAAYQGMNPFIDDCYLIGYDTKDGPQFSTIVSYQAYLKRAEAHPSYDGKECGVLIYDDSKDSYDPTPIEGDVYPRLKHLHLVGGWCRIYRRGRSHPEYHTARLQSYEGKYGHWQTDPAFMIMKCAVAKCIRSAFPFDLGNFYIAAEIAAFEKSHEAEQKPLEPSKADVL